MLEVSIASLESCLASDAQALASAQASSPEPMTPAHTDA
jgi:hypothetical protein